MPALSSRFAGDLRPSAHRELRDSHLHDHKIRHRPHSRARLSGRTQTALVRNDCRSVGTRSTFRLSTTARSSLTRLLATGNFKSPSPSGRVSRRPCANTSYFELPGSPRGGFGKGCSSPCPSSTDSLCLVFTCRPVHTRRTSVQDGGRGQKQCPHSLWSLSSRGRAWWARGKATFRQGVASMAGCGLPGL